MRSLSISLLIALLEVPLLPALSAAASGEQASPVHYSRIPPVHRAIHPLDGPWPDRRSAAKSLEVCPSMDIPSLQADALVDYLRSTSHHCVEQSLLSRDPDYRRAWPVVFSDANMQSVFAEIERLAFSYDGTDDSGMLNLWFFVRSGYGLYRWFPGTGVGPFNDATVQAFLDASDAFGASDHLLDSSGIFYEYFETGYAAGLQEIHLAPINRALSEFNPDDLDESLTISNWYASESLSIFDRVVSRTYAAFRYSSDRMPEFISAASQDPAFLEALLQASLHDSFYFFEEEIDPFRWRLRLLEVVVNTIVELSKLDASAEAATAALIEVVQWQERLNGAFLLAADRLEHLVECSPYNICRDILEAELYERALPRTYQLNDDLVIHTPLDIAAVRRFAQGAREIKSRFHRLTQTDEGKTHLDTFRVRAYGSYQDYYEVERYLAPGVETRGIHAGGYYSQGVMASYDKKDQNTTLEDTFLHEYGHYLADRYGLLTIGDPWFDEGLAEFLHSDPAALIWQIDGSPRLSPSEVFDFVSYEGHSFTIANLYLYSNLWFHFMHQERRTQLMELLDLVGDEDSPGYQTVISAWRSDSQMEEDFDRFLVEHLDARGSSTFEAPYSFILPPSLMSDRADEIERALQAAGPDLSLNCEPHVTPHESRFRCSGSLPADPAFSGDRGELNEHLNARLDDFIAEALNLSEINNLTMMTCYFTDVSGDPLTSDLRCEGPLRPTDVDLQYAHLQSSVEVFSDEGGIRSVQQTGSGEVSYVGERLQLTAYLEFDVPEVSNVVFTWTSNPAVVESGGYSSCEKAGGTFGVLEVDEGVQHCGTVGGQYFSVAVLVKTLEPGLHEFSVSFESSESEDDLSDNTASVEVMIHRMPQHLESVSGFGNIVTAMAPSHDNSMLAVGLIDGQVETVDVETQAVTTTSMGSAQGGSLGYPGIRSLAFSPNDSLLAVGLHGGAVNLRGLSTGTLEVLLSDLPEGPDLVVTSVAFSPDGSMLAAGFGDSDRGVLKTWDLSTGTSASYSWATGYVLAVAFSPDGSTLAAALSSGGGPDANTVKLMNLDTKEIRTLSGHREHISDIAFSRDGSVLVSGAADGTVRVWNLETESSEVIHPPNGVSTVAISPSGDFLAVAQGDDTIGLVDWRTGEEVLTLFHAYSVHSLAFLNDGGTLISSDARTVEFWDVSHWTVLGPELVSIQSGDEQEADMGMALAEPFVVSVLDQHGDPYAGAEVAFTITAGDGTLSTATATTDTNGLASATLTLGRDPGPNTVEATVTGLEPVVFAATTKASPDFDQDGQVGLSDFFLFAEHFGSNDPRFDLDSDGSVDFADFFLFAEHFGEEERTKLIAWAHDSLGLPDSPQLHQNTPNPFNGQTVISWFVMKSGPAHLEVYALTGQRVAVLSQGFHGAGIHRLQWDGRDQQGRPLASGVYVYRLVTPRETYTRKMTLLR